MKQVISSERLPIKMWLDDIEEGAVEQAKNLANIFFTEKWVALAPDCHQGYGMPIGGIIGTKNVVSPNCIGVDIACGVVATRLSIKEIDTDTLKKVMGFARTAIPVGFYHHKTEQDWEGFDRAPDIKIIQSHVTSARKQLGTLGGGNHFIELQKGNDGYIWIMIHSGSRNIGYKVAKHFHDLAKKLCKRWNSDVPDMDLAFLPLGTNEAEDYLASMNYCLEFGKASRNHMMQEMINIIAFETGAVAEDSFDIHHNYAAWEHHYGQNLLIHRKGATRARAGERGIIPGSMGTSSYIVEGLGNPESFMSCSHGAGRTMSRTRARAVLSLEEEQKKMEGVVHGLRNNSNLDEAPGAYKDINKVMANQTDLVNVLVELKPLGVIKG